MDRVRMCRDMRERICLLIVSLGFPPTNNQGSLMVDDRSDRGAAKILCVDRDLAVLESRCVILKISACDSISTPLQFAELVLAGKHSI
jgi:hypothetical protein